MFPQAFKGVAGEATAREEAKLAAIFNAYYNSLIAPWRTVICVTGSPELFNSVRI